MEAYSNIFNPEEHVNTVCCLLNILTRCNAAFKVCVKSGELASLDMPSLR